MKEGQANPLVALALVDDVFLFVRDENLLLPVASQQDLWAPRQGRTILVDNALKIRTQNPPGVLNAWA